MNSQISGTRDLSFVLSGAAGLGIQTVEEFLCRVLCRAGLHVFASREYMSRVRGGNNSTEIRVGTKAVRAFSDRMDYLFPLTPGVRVNISRRISPDFVGFFVGGIANTGFVIFAGHYISPLSVWERGFFVV